MIRLLILLFALNTVLAPMGVAAMIPVGMDTVMNQESKHSVVISTATDDATSPSHCSNISSHHACNIDSMSSDLCKEKCATSCTISPAHIASFSFSFPLGSQNNNAKIAFIFFHSRSISPELPPPLV